MAIRALSGADFSCAPKEAAKIKIEIENKPTVDDQDENLFMQNPFVAPCEP
jgi:hypothetical protein